MMRGVHRCAMQHSAVCSEVYRVCELRTNAVVGCSQYVPLLTRSLSLVYLFFALLNFVAPFVISRLGKCSSSPRCSLFTPRVAPLHDGRRVHVLRSLLRFLFSSFGQQATSHT